MTYTPGPWHHYCGQVYTKWKQLSGASSYHRFICAITGQNPDVNANAALIAAAPELLEACKALLSAFEGYEMLAALDATVQEQARVAIAKAEGEQ